jgi:hypothetical protein
MSLVFYHSTTVCMWMYVHRFPISLVNHHKKFPIKPYFSFAFRQLIGPSVLISRWGRMEGIKNCIETVCGGGWKRKKRLVGSWLCNLICIYMLCSKRIMMFNHRLHNFHHIYLCRKEFFFLTTFV